MHWPTITGSTATDLLRLVIDKEREQTDVRALTVLERKLAERGAKPRQEKNKRHNPFTIMRPVLMSRGFVQIHSPRPPFGRGNRPSIETNAAHFRMHFSRVSICVMVTVWAWRKTFTFWFRT
jgi:hypothetical protein